MDAATRLDYAAPYMFVTSQAAAGGKAALLVSKDGSPFQPVDLSYIPLAQVRQRPLPVARAAQCSAVQRDSETAWRDAARHAGHMGVQQATGNVHFRRCGSQRGSIGSAHS